MSGLPHLVSSTYGIDELEDGVLADLRVVGSKLLESDESRVGLSEDGMTISRNDSATLENAPDEVLDLFLSGIVSDLLLHVEDESENLLISETVEGTGQASETGRVSKERIGESRANQVDGVGRDIASLVVGYKCTEVMSIRTNASGLNILTVDSVVETDDLDEASLVTETNLVGEVPGEILGLV